MEEDLGWEEQVLDRCATAAFSAWGLEEGPCSPPVPQARV